MDAIITKLIEELNSSVFVLLGVLIIMGWMVYKAGILFERFKNHEQKLDEVRGIQNEMISIRTKVDLIYQNTNPNALFRTQSPLALTPKGTSVAETLSAHSILERHYKALHESVESESPKTAYDIQLAAMKTARETLLSLLTEQDLIAIKNEAFKQGAPLDDILVVFGILLRNRILSERGIPLTDVDLTDPAS